MANATSRSADAEALVASKAEPAKPASPASSNFRFCSSSSFTPWLLLNHAGRFARDPLLALRAEVTNALLAALVHASRTNPSTK
ncbi:hypothetical protein MRX96_024089 [Rhipicephalus microplus]